MIGSVIGFIIYNLNFCFKPWLVPFKSTIAKILTMPKKGEIGKILGNVIGEDSYEKELLTNNPFPLFFSAQSNYLIDFLKYLNPDYAIKIDTKLDNKLDNDTLNIKDFKELYKTLLAIEKNATLVWVILFAIFFSQTTITYMNYVV